MSFSASQGQGCGIGDRDGENLYAQRVERETDEKKIDDTMTDGTLK